MTKLGVFATIKEKLRDRYNENKEDREKMKAVNEAIRLEAKKVRDEEYIKEKCKVEIENAKAKAKSQAQPLHKKLANLGEGMSGVMEGLVGKPDDKGNSGPDVNAMVFGKEDDRRKPHKDIGDMI